MPRPLRALAALAASASLLLGAAGPALADSDPASDILPTQNVYVPYSPKVSAKLVGDLRGVTAASKKAGYRIKVAIVGTAVDLGGVPNLMNQPTQYAGYLGREIAFNDKRQALLVVMPDGIGTFQAGPKASAAIADLKVGSGSDGMAKTAVEAVQKLAAASGHPIHGFKPAAAGGGGSTSPVIFAIPVALLVLVFAVLTYRRLGDEDEEEDEPEPGPAQ